MPDYPKKLIEVALPLDDINVAAGLEKKMNHSHPSTLHLWWARRPLAVARAILFAQLVNDPGGWRGYGAKKGQTKADAQKERDRLVEIIRDLVKWENIANEDVLERARVEIRRSWVETCRITGEDSKQMPPFLDPFAGGGSIPLEAQRLGLEANGSDLNPVAVMINMALIEIPPKFCGRAPVGLAPKDEKQTQAKGTEDWTGTRGLAEDVRRYGAWMRDEALSRIGHLYPKIKLPKELGRSEATVITWLWARTVASPNPAVGGAHVPLASSFWLTSKKGRETWVEPVIEKGGRTYHFAVKTGTPKDPDGIGSGTKLGRGANFRCILTDTPISPDYIKSEGKAGRMGARLMAVVAEGRRTRVYLAPTEEHERIAQSAKPLWSPQQELPKNPRWFSPPDYGMPLYSDLFTARQLVTLTTFSDLVFEARQKVLNDFLTASLGDKSSGLITDKSFAADYADAVSVYLALCVSKMTAYHCTLGVWRASEGKTGRAFGRQALPMVWDFPECNPFAGAGGDWEGTLVDCQRVLSCLSGQSSGFAHQKIAQERQAKEGVLWIVSTDPPYYDNVGYADLSDFFYVWMRRTLKRIFPSLFSTLLVPKADELVATPYRHGSKAKAEGFFLEGMTKALHNLAVSSHPAFPVTIYYAFKQSETADEGTSSTGWETFLEAVKMAGFSITGTWPMRTEQTAALKTGINSLASSIVLVCRVRPTDAPSVSRKQFLRELEESLPEALEEMIGGKEGASPISPVDLAQAAIGPGIGVFSRYAAVLEADGSPMSVRTALTLINKAVDEYFTHAESDMDADTRFCVDWFQQYGFKSGPFGEADVLARAKGTSVEGVREAHVIESKGGKVRLLAFLEYPPDWNPDTDPRVPVWEACHHMIRLLQTGETAAGAMLGRLREKAEPIRQLAYRLYTLCERTGRAEEARSYNELVTSWHAIAEASHRVEGPQQMGLL